MIDLSDFRTCILIMANHLLGYRMFKKHMLANFILRHWFITSYRIQSCAINNCSLFCTYLNALDVCPLKKNVDNFYWNPLQDLSQKFKIVMVCWWDRTDHRMRSICGGQLFMYTRVPSTYVHKRCFFFDGKQSQKRPRDWKHPHTLLFNAFKCGHT